MRATRKRTSAIIKTMKDDDSLTMIQAAQINGVPASIAAEWYQHGSEWAAGRVKQEFYRAVHKLFMDRERREMDMRLIQTIITQAQAGDRHLLQILKKKGIDYSQQ
jgi:hypothetical protein